MPGLSHLAPRLLENSKSMPNVPSVAVGFITIESEKAPVEGALSSPPADATLKETLIRLAGGVPSPLRPTRRHLSRHDRISRFGSSTSAEQSLRRRPPSRLRGRTAPPPSATVYVEVDLPRLVDQLKAEAEALSKRISAAMDVARRAAAIDTLPKPKAH